MEPFTFYEKIILNMNNNVLLKLVLGIYHVGVAVCFKKYAPHLLLDKISGASVGALSACCLLCDMPLGKFFNHFTHIKYYYLAIQKRIFKN
jgi:hypothetical protein